MEPIQQHKSSAAISALLVTQCIALDELTRHDSDLRYRLRRAFTEYADFYSFSNQGPEFAEEVDMVRTVVHALVRSLLDPEKSPPL